MCSSCPMCALYRLNPLHIMYAQLYAKHQEGVLKNKFEKHLLGYISLYIYIQCAIKMLICIKIIFKTYTGKIVIVFLMLWLFVSFGGPPSSSQINTHAQNLVLSYECLALA